MPDIARTIDDLRARVNAARRAGKRIGVVPTMGALHEGHLSLVAAAEKECDFVVVTIFVNPTQFGPNEDFTRYPRTWDDDLRMLSAHRVDVVFAPETKAMYPDGMATSVSVAGVALPWEGVHRPGHFDGVATIVLKLFNLVQPDVAYFGRKDLQQSLVIAQMVRDFDVPAELRVCPTVREPDGLAMSSRNRYLNREERAAALSLSRALNRGAELVRQGETDASRVMSAIRDTIAASPLVRLEYLAIVNPRDMAEVSQLDSLAYAVVAARVGNTRLIDNVPLEGTR
jgi:pantoate--beta-alanine ligase